MDLQRICSNNQTMLTAFAVSRIGGRRENQDQQPYGAPSQGSYQRPSAPAYQAPNQYTAPSQPAYTAPSVDDNPADDLPF